MRLLLCVAAVLLWMEGTPVQGNDDGYTFQHKSPVVGEQWTNKVQFDMSLKTKYRYPGQETQQTISQDQQHQVRELTVLTVQPDYSTQVKVFFKKASRQTRTADQKDTEWLPQPVNGKTYVVRRAENELIVINQHGQVPPDNELTIVKQSMQSIGRPNPLAQFLTGRTIAIGETVQLPAELASSFLGSTQATSQSKAVPMKLVNIRDIDGVSCGIFAAKIHNISQNGPRTSTHMTGHLAVQLNTCRTIYVSFRGPVTMRQTRMVANQEYTVEATGSLAVAMRTAKIQR